MTCSGTLVHNLELLRDLVVSQVVTGWNRNPGKGPNLHVTHRVLMTHAAGVRWPSEAPFWASWAQAPKTTMRQQLKTSEVVLAEK
jgi:hypothetical protein